MKNIASISDNNCSYRIVAAECLHLHLHLHLHHGLGYPTTVSPLSRQHQTSTICEDRMEEREIDRKLIFPLAHVILINRHLCSEEKRHVRFRL
jgi:hypothetical protein